jgi:hypothetical protein
MVAPLTPKPTRKAETLDKAPSTIVSRHEEDVELKKWPKPWLCCANGILETKANDGSTVVKAPDPRTNPNTKEAPTTPKPHTHPSHEHDGQPSNPGSMTVPPTPKPTRKAEVLTKALTTMTSRREEDTVLKKCPKPRLYLANGILESKENYGNTEAKDPVPRTNPKANEVLTTPQPHTHTSHPQIPHPSTPSGSSGFTSCSCLL